jgi:plastocyanin
MARNKKYTVRVSYKVYDYYTIEAKNEQEAIEQALETSATDSLNDFTQDGEGEAIVTMIGNKSVEPEQEQEHGKQIELDYDAGDVVTWHCDDDGQDHTSTITGITIEVNSEGEAEVTYKTEIEFKGRKQDAYFSEYDIVNK